MKKRCVRCRLEYPEEETECEICRLPLVPVEEEAPKEEPNADAQDEPKPEAAGEPPEAEGRGAPYKATMVTVCQSVYLLLGIGIIIFGAYRVAQNKYGYSDELYLLAILIQLIPITLIGLFCMEQGALLGLMLDTNAKLSDEGETKRTPYDSKLLTVMQKVLFVLGCIGFIPSVFMLILLFIDSTYFSLQSFIFVIISSVTYIMESQKIGLLMDSNRKAIR